MKHAVTFIIGILFSVVAIQIVGFGAAITVPNWLSSLTDGDAAMTLLCLHLIYIALPLFLVAAVFGASASRALKTRSTAMLTVLSLPYLSTVLYGEIAGPSTIFGPLWFLSAIVFLSAVGGLVLGGWHFGVSSGSGNNFPSTRDKSS